MGVASLDPLIRAALGDYSAWDIGRRIVPLEPIRFARFEAGEAPYPYPLQRHAWFALLGGERGAITESRIWFLKFPLDENAHLATTVRDDFIAQLAELALTQSAEQRSPYGFKPKETIMASFHARIRYHLDQPPSHFYPHACDYLSGALGYDQWSFVGVQGLADIAARAAEPATLALISAALPNLPAPPLQALCQGLEHERLPTPLAHSLEALAHAELDHPRPDPERLAVLLRGLSASPDHHALRHALLERVMATPLIRQPALLAAIASRCWQDLQSPRLAMGYVEALAANSMGQPIFDQIMADLLFIPGMRRPLLDALRDPRRSDRLARAVGALLGG